MKKLFLSLALLLAAPLLNAVSFDLTWQVADQFIERHIQGDLKAYTISYNDLVLKITQLSQDPNVLKCETFKEDGTLIATLYVKADQAGAIEVGDASNPYFPLKIAVRNFKP